MSIFDEKKEESIPTEENKSIVSDLVGEGKKYSSYQELEKAYTNADQFINRLKEEGVQLRGELDKRLNAEDMVEQIKREREELKAQAEAAQGNTTPQFDESKLTDLISSTLAQKETQKTVEANILNVDAKMKEMYGEKAKDVLHQKASENAVSVEFMMEVAAKSPTAFFNTLGISAKGQTTPSNTHSSGTNTQAMNTSNSSTEVGTWKYFEELRKSNPKEYYKPATQNQLFKMRTEKGQEAFYS